jgi:hypothetical protein
VRQPNSSGIGEGERDRFRAGDHGGVCRRRSSCGVSRRQVAGRRLRGSSLDPRRPAVAGLCAGRRLASMASSSLPTARAVIFVSRIHEGAGHELRVISTRHGLRTLFCVTLPGAASCSVPRWLGTRGLQRRFDRTRHGARRSLPRRAPRSSCRSERPANGASIGRRCAGFAAKSNRLWGSMSGPPSGLRAPVRSLVIAGGR